MLKRLLTAAAALLLSACTIINITPDDDKTTPSGEDNTIDVIVTGDVVEAGMTYARVLGYTNNLSLETLVGLKTLGFIGVEYGLSEDAMTGQAGCDVIEGRKLDITINGLLPGTKYYYRAALDIEGVRKVGREIRSFTTKAFEFEGSVLSGATEDIDYESARITGIGIEGSIPDGESFIWGLVVTKDLELLDRWEYGSEDGVTVRVLEESFMLYNLFPGTTYYRCGFLYMGGRTVTGPQRKFTTLDVPRSKFVDLGLSVKWASCNIGQSTPWVDYSVSGTKGTELSWDQASAAIRSAYGPGARLPSKAEWEELLELLREDIHLTEQKNFHGGCAVITGAGGKSIAVPAGEIYWTATPQFNTEDAHHTAHIYTTYPWRGWDIGVSDKYGTDNSRKYMVRAVLDYGYEETWYADDVAGTYEATDWLWDSSAGSWGWFDPFDVILAEVPYYPSYIQIMNFWDGGKTIDAEIDPNTGDIYICPGVVIYEDQTTGPIRIETRGEDRITLTYNPDTRSYRSSVFLPTADGGFYGYYCTDLKLK